MELSHNVLPYLDRREYPFKGKVMEMSQTSAHQGKDLASFTELQRRPGFCGVRSDSGLQLLLTPNPRENLQHLLCVPHREASAEAMETDRAGATRKALTQLQLLSVCVQVPVCS